MTRARPPMDLVLLGAVLILVPIGALMVYSASLVTAYNQLQDDTFFIARQLIWLMMGLVAMALIARLDYHIWRRYSLVMLMVGIVLLVVVLIPSIGTTSYGSTRWIKLVPFFQIQPSELIKIVLVLYMADWLASKGSRVGELFASSLPFLIILGVVCSLVVVEPDFGTTVVIAATAVSIFFVAGANLVHFAVGSILMTGVFWVVINQAGYRVQRIVAWLDPWQDKQGAGWHTIQTLVALGSGGLTGLGLGASRQKHSWLANAHTDAIMAVVGEELGLVGTLTVLLLLGAIVWRGLVIAYRAPDAYGRLIAAGLATMIFWQAAINIAVVTNTLPYTGVTLPLVSFGGSSTVVSLAAIGLLLSISRQRSRAEEEMPATPPDHLAVERRLRRSGMHRRPAPETTLARVRSAHTPVSIGNAQGASSLRRAGRVR